MSQSTVIPVTRRADLQSAPTSLRGQPTFTVKDPVASRFFQLRPVEWFILEQLREPVSWAELKQRVNDEFAPQRITAQQLESFVSTLHREGLVASHAPNQGEVMLRRRDSRQQREWWSRWANPLAIRFRGVNLSSTLDQIAPHLGWLFSPLCMALSACWLAATMLYALIHWPTLATELPNVGQWMTVDLMLWVGVAVGLSKVLHEMGHAVACHRMGGRCREIGVMLLVFVPCLYCDVSDAWLIRGKWRRILISGAGIWVELMLACAGFWVWRLTDPGWLHWLSLSLAATCSVNTILFNGNALLRYDGYFMLADYWEIPNLMEQSRQRLREILLKWTMGVEPRARARVTAPDRLLVPYAIASTAYRWMVLLLIWWALDAMLRPWGLQALALAMLWMSVAAMAASPLTELYRWLARPRRREKLVNWKRLSLTAGLVAALLVLAVLTPLANNVTAPAVVRARGAVPLRVLAAGRVVWTEAIGAEIQSGDVIARLENADLARDLSLAETERLAAARAVASLKELGTADANLEQELVIAERKLTRAAERVRELQYEQEQLTVRAPLDGTLAPSRTRSEDLSWSGSLLDSANRGAFAEVNDPIGVLIDRSQLEVVAVVSQSMISLVQQSQEVVVSPNATASEIRGVVSEISEVDADHPPAELVEANLIAASPTADGPQSLETLFTVRITIDAEHDLPIGSIARVKILTPRRTLWEQLRRAIASWRR